MKKLLVLLVIAMGCGSSATITGGLPPATCSEDADCVKCTCAKEGPIDCESPQFLLIGRCILPDGGSQYACTVDKKVNCGALCLPRLDGKTPTCE